MGSTTCKRIPEPLEAAVAGVLFVDGGEVGIEEFWPKDVMKVPAVGRKSDDLPMGVVVKGVTDIGGGGREGLGKHVEFEHMGR